MSQEAPGWTPLPVMSMDLPPLTIQSQRWPVASASLSTGAHTGGIVPRRRFPQEAYNILIDFYDKHPTKYPRRDELEDLVARVRGLQGCDDYTVERASAYIASRRKIKGDLRRRSKEADAPSSSAHILYPSIAKHPSVVDKLDVLLAETPEPPLELARIWATKLGRGVRPEDVRTYAELRRIQRKHEIPSITPRVSVLSSQLPTPESSISPEPHSTPTSPVVETSWGKVESEDEVKDELEDDEEEETALPEQYDPRCPVIAEEFSKALALSPPSHGDLQNMPKSFADLTRWFREQSAVTTLMDTRGKSSPRQVPPVLSRRPTTPSEAAS